MSSLYDYSCILQIGDVHFLLRPQFVVYSNVYELVVFKFMSFCDFNMSSTYTFTVTVPYPLIFVWIFVEFRSTFLSYTLSSPTFTVSFFSFTVVELDEPVVFVVFVFSLSGTS